jgi:hypothetical protein
MRGDKDNRLRLLDQKECNTRMMTCIGCFATKKPPLKTAWVGEVLHWSMIAGACLQQVGAEQPEPLESIQDHQHHEGILTPK